MKPNFKKLLLIAATATATLVSSNALAASDTFATFHEATAVKGFNFSNNGAIATFSATNDNIFFDFTGISGLAAALTGDQAAKLTMSSTTTAPVTLFGGFFDVQSLNKSSTISIIRNTKFAAINGNFYDNLLTITFNAASIGYASLFGVSGANSLAFSASNGSVTFTSDFLNFSQSSTNDLGLALTGLSNAVGITGSFLSPFLADATGTFSSDPGATAILAHTTAPVPEPETYAMMLAGLALVGFVSRRKISKKTV